MSWKARLEQTREPGAFPVGGEDGYADTGLRADKRYSQLKETVHREVVGEYNSVFSESGSRGDRDVDVMELIHQTIAKQEQTLTRRDEQKVAQEIYDEVMGLGPLEVFLRDKTITEVMVNGSNQIYIERFGKLELTGASFRDEIGRAHV